jgi:5-methylcytosine-specific restriction endonuclease McrA
MSCEVLLLNADYQPLKVIDYKRAIMLYLDGKVHIVEEYAGRMIRSMTEAIPWPAVVALKKFVRVRSRVRFKRHNVLARDNFTCQYCGKKPRTQAGLPDVRALTLDHVVPRSRGIRGRVTLPWNGKSTTVTGWENIVTCCEPCNRVKADRTPSEAKMTLCAKPRRPNAWDILRIIVSRTGMPDEWSEHVPTT